MICPNCKCEVRVAINYKNYGRDLGIAKYNAMVAEIGDVSGRIEELNGQYDKDGDVSKLDEGRLFDLMSRYNKLDEEIGRFVFI